MSLQNLNPQRRRRAVRHRRGYALLLVMVVILTSSAFVAVHQRHLSAALRIEQARIESEEYRTGPVSVLAVAATRLETGNPPDTEYRYSHTVGITTNLYRITYLQSGARWTITAVPDPTANALTELPATF